GPDRDRRIADFGRAVAPLLHGGVYLGVDQGMTYRDRDLFFAAAGYDVCASAIPGLPCDWATLWARCQTIPGSGICEAIETAIERLALHGCRRIVIQGFGTVGRAVAVRM